MVENLQWMKFLLMKNKHLLSLFLLIIATCVFLWVFVSPLAELDYDMNSPKGYYTISPPRSIYWQQPVKEIPATPSSTPESKTFPGQFSKTPARVLNNTDHVIPVIASLVHAGNLAYLNDLMDSVKEHVPYLPVVLHEMGLDSSDLDQLGLKCNSTNNCDWRTFPYDKFPFHVRNLETKAYKPIIIQDVLHEFGACVWIDITHKGYTFVQSNITNVLIRSRKVGLAAWTIRDPTSALTHPKTLRWLKTSKEKYYFHRMIVASHIVLVNSALIRDRIVRPWVVCALAPRCIEPLGSQSFGCNHNRKPLFRYSGCHGYEMSVLNVLLGPVFDFDWRTYTVADQVFGRIDGNETETLNYHLSNHHLLR